MEWKQDGSTKAHILCTYTDGKDTANRECNSVAESLKFLASKESTRKKHGPTTDPATVILVQNFVSPCCLRNTIAFFCDLLQLFALLLATQVMVQALEIASKTGSHDVSELVSQCSSNGVGAPAPLGNMDDVTGKLLEVAPPGPVLPKSAVPIQKAAIMTFQTWAARSPERIQLAAVLFGMPMKGKAKRWSVVRLIVDSNIKSILSSDRVKLWMDENGSKPLGVALYGNGTQQQLLDTGKDWCSTFLGPDVDTTLCVLVSWHINVSFAHKIVLLYIYIYI